MSEQDSISDISPGTMTVSEVMTLVNLFNSMLQAMEARILGRLDDNSAMAAERWRLHDEDLERNRASIIAKFASIEESIALVESSLKAHLDKEHDEDVANEARVKPVKNLAGWLWGHWRDLVLLFIGLVAAGTFLLDWITHMIDGFPT